MKWALMGVALFELIVILVSVIIYFDYNSRRDLGTLEGVLFLMALLTIVNLLVPILRNKNLDTKDKRKMSLLIFGGLGLAWGPCRPSRAGPEWESCSRHCRPG